MSTTLNKYPFQLQDVRLYELSLKRVVQKEPASNDGMRLEIMILDNHEPDSDHIFIQLVLDLPITDENENLFASIHLSIEGMFGVEASNNTITPEIIDEFKKHSAFFILFPYLRQMLDDFTTRARLEIPPLPIIPFDAFTLSSTPPSE